MGSDHPRWGDREMGTTVIIRAGVTKEMGTTVIIRGGDREMGTTVIICTGVTKEMGTTVSCTECSQAAALIQKVGRSSLKAPPSLCAALPPTSSIMSNLQSLLLEYSEPLYYRRHWDQNICPDERGVLISGCLQEELYCIKSA